MRFSIRLILISLLFATPASAGVAGQAINTLARNLTRETAKQVVKQTVKQTSLQVARQGAKHTAQRSAAYATRHFGQAATKSAGFVDDLARASARLSPRDQRRLAMLASELNKSGQSATVIKQLASGPQAKALITRLWSHRGKLASAAAVTTLLLHGDDVAEASGKYIAKPVIEASMQHVVSPLVTVMIRLFWLFAIIVVGVGIALQSKQPFAIRLKNWLQALIAQFKPALPLLSRHSKRVLQQYTKALRGNPND